MNRNKLNNIKLDKVIKESDVAVILGAEEYAQKLKQENEKILNNSKRQIDGKKKEAYDETVQKLVTDNETLLNNFTDNVDRFLNKMSDNIFHILYKLLQKLGQDNINTKLIKSMIENELANTKINNITRIVANGHVISEMQTNLSSTYFESVIWEVNDNFGNDECVCTTALWTMRISIEKALNELLKTIQPKKDETEEVLNAGA